MRIPAPHIIEQQRRRLHREVQIPCYIQEISPEDIERYHEEKRKTERRETEFTFEF